MPLEVNTEEGEEDVIDFGGMLGDDGYSLPSAANLSNGKRRALKSGSGSASVGTTRSQAHARRTTNLALMATSVRQRKERGTPDTDMVDVERQSPGQTILSTPQGQQSDSDFNSPGTNCTYHSATETEGGSPGTSTSPGTKPPPGKK